MIHQFLETDSWLSIASNSVTNITNSFHYWVHIYNLYVTRPFDKSYVLTSTLTLSPKRILILLAIFILQRLREELSLFFYTLDRKLLRNFINASPIQKSSKLVFALSIHWARFTRCFSGIKKPQLALRLLFSLVARPVSNLSL